MIKQESFHKKTIYLCFCKLFILKIYSVEVWPNSIFLDIVLSKHNLNHKPGGTSQENVL
jgi:hypothetical protein